MIGVSHVVFLCGRDGGNAIGGAEHHVMTLVEHLASRGVDTELIVLLWKDDAQIQATLSRLKAAGVRIEIIERRAGGPSLLSRMFRALDCWRRLSVRLRSRRDRVIHMHMELVAQVVAASAAGCRRLVMTIHNDEPHYRRPTVKAWFRVLTDILGIQVIAITDHVKSHLIEAVGVPARSVRTVRYGVPDRLVSTLSRQDIGLSHSEFVVGFVGRLTVQKNVTLLIRAMATRPDITCVIVGDGELRTELESLAQSLGCRNVRFLGAQPDAARFMPLFDVFCLPSIWEGLGVVLLEAMLQKVPIVGSRAGAVPEVLGRGTCGLLIDPHSVDSLVDAIDRLRNDPSLRRTLARNGYQHARTEYSLQRMEEHTCQIYQDVCETMAESSPVPA
jgi:glycosyltransferase involved in cell wall biosynthesis